MRDRIHAAAEAAGRDPGEVTLVYNIDLRVGRAAELPPHVLSGPPDALAETIAGFSELGFRAFNLYPVGPGYGDHVEQLGREVVPNVRAAL